MGGVGEVVEWVYTYNNINNIKLSILEIKVCERAKF